MRYLALTAEDRSDMLATIGVRDIDDLFAFQTQVALLTGMEVANASMYDGSTAAAEAVLMAHRITKRKKALLAGNLHPHYRETVETVSSMSDHAVVALPSSPQGT